MRAPRVALLALLAGVACAKPVPFTSDLKQEMAASNVADLNFRILGTFELRSSGRSTIVVKNYATAFEGAAPNDTTITVGVLGAQIAGQYDTLRLTFALSKGTGSCSTRRACAQAGAGTYTLRQINGTPIGGSIPIGGTVYQYHPCYQNVGSQCNDPIPTGAAEDRQVHIGVMK